MSLLDLLEEKAKTHRCRRCNRPLTDAESIALGIGPICRQKETVKLSFHTIMGTQDIEFCLGGSGVWPRYKKN